MNSDLKQLRARLQRFVAQERSILVKFGMLRLLSLVAFLLMFATLAAWKGISEESATFILICGAGIGLWSVFGAPRLARWRRSADLKKQSEVLEGIRPELHGRLRTAVERMDGPRTGESEVILSRIVNKASKELEAISPIQVYPNNLLRNSSIIAGGAWLAACLGLILSPLGIKGTALWWFGGVSADAAVMTIPPPAGPQAKIGDLIIRYVYPEYTGLEPKEVPNSTGDVHGPLGTQVEVKARSAEVLESAALSMDDTERLEAQLSSDRRSIESRFSIESGHKSWRIITFRNGEERNSRSFAITAEPDLAPEVVVEAPDTIEVGLDERFRIQWRAQDDYGISKVLFSAAGRELGSPLGVPRERRARLEGEATPSPRSLGLEPGDKINLIVSAWDNDAVSGSKEGRSRVIRLVVLGDRGMAARIEERQRELREQLLTLLADGLEEPWPPGRTQADFTVWGEKVAKRYAALRQWSEKAWGERPPKQRQERLERKLLGRVLESGRSLIRFSQVGFAIESLEPAKTEDIHTVLGLRNEAIQAVEDAILGLDRMIQSRALEAVAKSATQLEQIAADVRAALPEMSSQEMLTRLEQMERALQRMQEEAARLEDNGLKEFTNQRADELKALSEEIRAALAKGDIEQAKKLMERMAKEFEALAQGIREQFEQGQQEGNETAEQAQSLTKELKALEQEQREIQEQTRKAREGGDAQAAKQAEKLWEQIIRLAEQHVRDAEMLALGPEAESRSFREQEQIADGIDQSEYLRDAALVRDLRGARQGVHQSRGAWEMIGWAIRGTITTRVPALLHQLDDIERLLEQLEENEQRSGARSPEQMAELEKRQRVLEKRVQETQQKAKELGEKLQSSPDGLEEGLEQAQQAMEQASEDLGHRQPMQAEGSQGSAGERLREAREALEEAMQDQQAMSSGSSRGEEGEEREEGQESEGSERGFDELPIEIPTPEQFRTPEEYRRELLEGMEGDVPEEYRAMKKRFFEELVNQ